VGLVVSPPALVKGQAIVNRNVVELQQALLGAMSQDLLLEDSDQSWIFDFPTFAIDVLGWEPDDLVRGEDLPTELEVVLPDYGEVLAPTYGVAGSGDAWQMLIQIAAPGLNLDEANLAEEKSGKWFASPQVKFERLLRETGVAVGLLCNGTQIRRRRG
jgi:hypothetical protein